LASLKGKKDEGMKRVWWMEKEQRRTSLDLCIRCALKRQFRYSNLP
jgi:hypothetical protein